MQADARQRAGTWCTSQLLLWHSVNHLAALFVGRHGVIVAVSLCSSGEGQNAALRRLARGEGDDSDVNARTNHPACKRARSLRSYLIVILLWRRESICLEE